MPAIVVLTPDQFQEALAEAYVEAVEGMAYALLGDAPGGDPREKAYDGPIPEELVEWVTGIRARAQGVRANGFSGFHV